MQLQTTFKFYKNDEAFYFGAYRAGSLTNGEPTIMFCMDAIVDIVQHEEDKTAEFKDRMLSIITHEFCHSMQEWLDKEFCELEVEKILGAYNEKWNVFNAEAPDEEMDIQFSVNELLEQMNDINPESHQSDEYKKGAMDYKAAIQ
ncbi:MAG: hypothetical protein ABIP68_06610, partial [Ferruginibacter sp.]